MKLMDVTKLIKWLASQILLLVVFWDYFEIVKILQSILIDVRYTLAFYLFRSIICSWNWSFWYISNYDILHNTELKNKFYRTMLKWYHFGLFLTTCVLASINISQAEICKTLQYIQLSTLMILLFLRWTLQIDYRHNSWQYIL